MRGVRGSASARDATGRLLARFLGVPLEREGHTVVRASGGRRRLLMGVLLYAIPVTVAIALLSTNLPEHGTSGVFPTTLAAIVLSQVGALLTLLYYRRRAPAPITPELHEHAAGECAAPRALSEPDRLP